MGKLVDTLQRAGKNTGSAIGFTGRAQSSNKPKAAAIIVTASADADVAALVKAGADVVVIPANAQSSAAKAAGVAWGIDARQHEKLNVADLRAWHEQGADFVLLPATVAVRVLSEPVEHLERALIIAPPQDDPLLIAFRALNLLEVDVAVLVLQLSAKDVANMQVPDFTRLRTLNETLRYPVILTVREIPASEDMHTLVRLGAQGLWLANATVATVTQFREALEQIPRDRDGLGGGPANALQTGR